VLLRARRQFNNAAYRKSSAFLRLHPFVVLLVNFFGDSNTGKNCQAVNLIKEKDASNLLRAPDSSHTPFWAFLAKTHTRSFGDESDVKSHAHLVKNYANKTHLSHLVKSILPHELTRRFHISV
jgi:hypothetical protein